MARKTELDSEYARSAARDAIPSLLGDASEQVLTALLENPHLDETHLCLLLEREDLPQTILERIARRRQWLSHYPVKRRVAFHPQDRKSTRLNSSHLGISYAVFCLKKKKMKYDYQQPESRL